MSSLRAKFKTANKYKGFRQVDLSGHSYVYLHNQDEDDFKVIDPATGRLAIDWRTGKCLVPRLDVEYPLLRAGFNAYNGFKYYANAMLTKGIDDFLQTECRVRRDSYDVSILLRLKTHDEVVTAIRGTTGSRVRRAPLAQGHSAKLIPLFQ